ncbi:carbohydrate sulfotransferase 1-like [Saccoglossus kowalevskii]|uniref:Carbohydrate sulfotransferase 1-like n=1 Tax=Saccoglossus kowalevskii TaxID=10224 RepID=A0ABM0LXR3_SACKO|nr:PREDICTED: carbohydrate sulfotransferase 1-like [Saccoglossus kowalevskii]
MKFHYRLVFTSAIIFLALFFLLSSHSYNLVDKLVPEHASFANNLRQTGDTASASLNCTWNTTSGNLFDMLKQLDDGSSGNPKKQVRVLVHARMRTGSSVTGGLFNDYPDFFFLYEPGHMLVEHKKMDLYGDNFKDLEKLRPDLMSFLNDTYHCNFSGKDFYLKSLKRHRFMRENNRALRGMKLPIKENDLIKVCESKSHIAVKTVRLNSLILAESVLRENEVRVVHVVRDPRGMMPSRRHMQGMRTSSGVTFEPKLERVVKDYCDWLEHNHVTENTGPDWLRKQYFCLRYEDLVDRPLTFVPELFKFAGLPLNDATMLRINSEEWWSNHGERWRADVTMKEVLRIQEICGEHIFSTLGYKMVYNEEDLTNMNKSLLMPF